MREITKLEDTEHNSKYNSIINLSYNLKHPRQSSYMRASQFAPFSALNGFEDRINEVGRITFDEIFLADEKMEDINDKLRILSKKIYKLNVNITYFVHDEKKKGGLFKNKIGYVKNVNLDSGFLMFGDLEKIKIKDIVNIEINDIH